MGEIIFRLNRSAAGPRKLITKAIRFGLVGVASGVIYTAVMVICVASFGVGPKLASSIGYLAALPLNFVAQRQYTFVANGIVWREVLRFVVVHAANIVVSVGAIAATVDGLGLHYGAGIVAIWLLVPMTTFLLMNFWVFPDQRT